MLILLLASVLIGLWLAKPVTATSPTTEESIIKPIYGPPVPSRLPNNTRILHGRHSTRAETTISTEALYTYLKAKNSPLAEYAGTILQSPYWSTIIGICTIEQYGCTKAPGNNYWGIMRPGGGLAQYATLEYGIEAISSLLARYESKGKDTIEELNGYYVQPASSNWFNTVLKTKSLIENL